MFYILSVVYFLHSTISLLFYFLPLVNCSSGLLYTFYHQSTLLNSNVSRMFLILPLVYCILYSISCLLSTFYHCISSLLYFLILVYSSISYQQSTFYILPFKVVYLTYRGVIWDVHGLTGGYLGCQGEGAEGPTNGPKGHSLLQELGISARSALYFQLVYIIPLVYSCTFYHQSNVLYSISSLILV